MSEATLGTETLLEVDGLFHEFARPGSGRGEQSNPLRVLDGLSLSVREGEFAAGPEKE